MAMKWGLACLFCLLPLFCKEPPESFLQQQIARQAHLGLSFIDLASGDVLFEHEAEKLFVPASVTKLFTSTALLDTLGENFQIRTSLLASTLPDSEGTLHSNLKLVGRGDPTLDELALARLAEQLYQKGVRRITGKVVADESYFDDIAPNPQAEWEDTFWYFSSELSPLSCEKNALELIVTPGPTIGSHASLTLKQKIPYLTLCNEVHTEKKERPLVVRRTENKRTLRIIGAVAKKPIKERLSLPSPADYTTELFTRALKKSGIIIDEQETKNETHLELTYILSPPLKDLLPPILKQSQNIYAELLLRVMGKETRPQGECLLEGRQCLARVLPSQNYRLFDGGGESRHNLVSPQHVTSLLRQIDAAPYRQAIFTALSIGGKDGCLANRFQKTFGEGNIRAKTGTVSGIATLAGYATSKKGRRIAFSLFLNHFTCPQKEARDYLDTLLLSLLEQS